MKLDHYQLKADESLTVFEFISEGPKGKISKLIQFTETNLKGFYNLGFGDKDAESVAFDDLVITNNSDGTKVLATVAASVYAFTEKYPNTWVYATGSTKARTRLYQIGINNHLDEISDDFEVYGLKDGTWYVFEKNKQYDAFLVKRKNR